MVTMVWTKRYPRKKSHPNLLHDKPVNTPYSNVDTEYQPKQNDHTATKKYDFMENSRPYTGVEGMGRRKTTKSVSQTVRNWQTTHKAEKIKQSPDKHVIERQKGKHKIQKLKGVNIVSSWEKKMGKEEIEDCCVSKLFDSWCLMLYTCISLV